MIGHAMAKLRDAVRLRFGSNAKIQADCADRYGYKPYWFLMVSVDDEPVAFSPTPYRSELRIDRHYLKMVRDFTYTLRH